MTLQARRAEEAGRILLVDDNRNGLSARKAVLEEIGYVTTTASSAEQALALVSEREFDLVVTDFRMPGMDGAELIRRIRAAHPRMRFILLSGFVEPLGLTEHSTGADVVISKSAGEVNILVRAVGRLLRKPPARQKPLRRAKARGAAAG